MSGVADFLFGGSDNSGQSAQIQANKDALKLQAGLANQARGDVTKLFPLSDVNRNVGYQSALDMIAAGTPNQINAFQQGNVGAQNALIGGQQQFQNAIMGNPIDMGQAQQFNVDTSYLNQQLPSFVGVGNIADLQNLLENPSSLANYLGGFGGAQSQNPPASAAQYNRPWSPDYGGGNSPDTGGGQPSTPDVGSMGIGGKMSAIGQLDVVEHALPSLLGLAATLSKMGIQSSLNDDVANLGLDYGGDVGPGTGIGAGDVAAGAENASMGIGPGPAAAASLGLGIDSYGGDQEAAGPAASGQGSDGSMGFGGGGFGADDGGESTNDGGGGGGGGGDGTVICTELHRQGLMSDEVYKLDAIFGDTLPQELIDGYHAWAVPWVGVMRKSKMATSITNVFAKPWSKYMANKVDPTIKGSAFGAVVHHVGGMFCMLVGKIKSQNAERLA